jgi:hypothetical protein
MRVGVLGTGTVGATIAGRLVELGHEVRMGSRSAGNPRAAAWVAAAGEGASEGTFADAAAFGELVVNCTAGTASVAALQAAGAEHLDGKVLMDIANPLDLSQGFPPSLSVANTDSLAEQIQRAFPGARVVKTLNTMPAHLMVDPAALPGSHVAFLSGDDDAAKDEVRALLGTFGWPKDALVDLGGIRSARGPEMYLALWLQLVGVLGGRDFNIDLRRA